MFVFTVKPGSISEFVKLASYNAKSTGQYCRFNTRITWYVARLATRGFRRRILVQDFAISHSVDLDRSPRNTALSLACVP